MQPASLDRNGGEPLRLALLAAGALAAGLLIGTLSGQLSLVELITPGGSGPSVDVVRADFGPEWVANELTGYDGQQVYAIARFFPDVRSASEHLDAPAYRLLRILSPALASPAPSGHATIAALLAVNVLGVGLAVYGGARILRTVRGRTSVALAAAAVLLLGVATTTDGPLTWGLTIAALSLTIEGRHRGAIVILVLAALSRETAAAAALCIGLGWLANGGSLRTATSYCVPGVVVSGWYLAVARAVEPGIPARADVLGFMAIEDPATVAVAIGTALLGLFAAWRWRDLPPVALCAAAFTAWMALYTPAILDPLALLRVNALPILLALLALGRLQRKVDPSDRHLVAAVT